MGVKCLGGQVFRGVKMRDKKKVVGLVGKLLAGNGMTVDRCNYEGG